MSDWYYFDFLVRVRMPACEAPKYVVVTQAASTDDPRRSTEAMERWCTDMTEKTGFEYSLHCRSKAGAMDGLIEYFDSIGALL